MTRYEGEERRIREGEERRKRPTGWNLERVLLILTFICSFTGVVFGLGVQWAKTTAVEAKVDAAPKIYVTRELYDADKAHLTEAVNRLTIAIDRMTQRQLDEAKGPAVPSFGKK